MDDGPSDSPVEATLPHAAYPAGTWYLLAGGVRLELTLVSSASSYSGTLANEGQMADLLADITWDAASGWLEFRREVLSLSEWYRLSMVEGIASGRSAHSTVSSSFEQWMEGVIENLDRAESAKLITKEVRQRVQARVPVVFAAIKERGYERGDRLLYRVRAGSLRMVVASEKGKIYGDTTDGDKDGPRVVMASYFAPKTDFREPLLRSLFD